MRYAILFLMFAQYLPQPSTKAVAPKAYTLTADQTRRLQQAADAHKACMAKKDPEARNQCFHPTHHAFWQACEQVKAEVKADPSATCSVDPVGVKQ